MWSAVKGVLGAVLGGKKKEGNGSESALSAGGKKAAPEQHQHKLVGRNFPPRVEPGVQYLAVETAEPLYPEPATLYGISEPTWVKKPGGALVERVTVWAYSLLRPLHGKPFRPALQFHVNPGVEFATTILNNTIIIAQRKPIAKDLLEMRVGHLETGVWRRKVLAGLTPQDLVPGTQFELTEALWAFHFDVLPLPDGSIIILHFFDQDDDFRIIKAFKFSPSGTAEKAEDGLETDKLDKVWGTAMAIKGASNIRRQFYRIDRIVMPGAGEMGIDFGKNDGVSSLACLVSTANGEWRQASLSDRKFPHGTAFPPHTRCAIKVRQMDGRRQFSHVFAVESENGVWRVGQRDPAPLRVQALRSFTSALKQLDSLDVAALKLKPDLAAMLGEHMKWNAAATSPIPLYFF